jgi:hypothetical protein
MSKAVCIEHKQMAFVVSSTPRRSVLWLNERLSGTRYLTLKKLCRSVFLVGRLQLGYRCCYMAMAFPFFIVLP